ncbi:uncharacterized protein LOC107016621 [Solanum pennellii]|uniref:Uncharacterized protein LOC107016621 n=1 Tax=Solanum pennellii TaxID=28526 RepID=A0ABM1GKV7_SOLPN|nr:uncharacterized protein LOC107016621 [Solanum pennellii]
MKTRRNASRRVEEAAAGGNQAPQAPAAGEQVPVNPAALTDGEVRAALVQMAQAITAQAHAITTQAAREGTPSENPHASTMARRLRDFTRMIPPIYFGSRTKEDLQDFVDEVHKILYVIGVNEEEKAELDAYQLKDVAQVWYNMWGDGRAPGEVPITWDVLKSTLLERFFPREQREAKVEEFINLRQGGMLVKEYSLKFVKISKYDSSLVSSSRDKMSRFVTGVSEDLEENCRESMLHDKMDLARLMVHAQQVEESRRRKRGREGKKPRPWDQAGSSTGRSAFGVQKRPKFKKGND